MFYGKVVAMLVWQFLAIRQIGCDVHYYLSLFALKSKLIEIIELEAGLLFRSISKTCGLTKYSEL